MAIQKTPGVYIEEIATLPASIAPVATAIPAFIGYTEFAGTPANPLTNVATRITSLLDYRQYFGGPFNELFSVTLSDAAPVVTRNAYTFSPYTMYYHLQLYFANGGGPCYIVSVGGYSGNTGAIDATLLTNGLAQAGMEDEVTLLVIPEAVSLADGPRKTLYDLMLSQCAKLQDRFAIFDVKTGGTTPVVDGSNFRNNSIGADNLKYGASYYPSLITAMTYAYDDFEVNITDNRTAPSPSLNNIPLGYLLNGQPVSVTIVVTDNGDIADDSFTFNGVSITAGTDFTVGANIAETARALRNAINAKAIAVPAIKNIHAFLDRSDATGATVIVVALATGTYTVNYDGGTADGATVTPSTGNFDAGDASFLNKDLYNSITTVLTAGTVTLYPSGAMAGVYAQVDNARGVWKAPANVSVAMVSAPSVKVTPDDQGVLNIDPTSGKSINVIRMFEGKGTIVWGARTLAGNDNEWRYVPVRRLFIFVEESVKKASEFVVFEPNDANTWIKVKTMIENFLTSLWRDGALAGAKPEAAFFVKVGLGTTMTALDILEGRMNIEIGLAAVRPAEFIILKFSHKLQES